MPEPVNPPFDFDNPPWIKNYDEGVVFKVDVPRILLHNMLKDVAEKYPDRPAVTFYGKSITYRELWSEVLRVADGLKKMGLGEDGCMVLILPNVPHYIILSFAAFTLGAKACLFNPLWSAYQVEDELAKIDPDIIIVQDILAEKYESVLKDRKNVYQAFLGDYATIGFKFKVSIGRMLGKLP
ncbi:MAG: AMP-binding protein, partial [Desulfurococcales archaeon]|nr:AMP-binding protein [Desulfurococcales archaeon]